MLNVFKGRTKELTKDALYLQETTALQTKHYAMNTEMNQKYKRFQISYVLAYLLQMKGHEERLTPINY